MREMFVRVAMMAARFCKAICSGSYRRDATKRNMKNAGTVSDPSDRNTMPMSAIVGMPNLKIIWAPTTKAALPNSVTTARFST